MQVMKKGKVHPSPPLPPSSSSSSSSNGDGSLSVLKLLPAAILVLVSVLSAKDQEVLGYLITRSLTTTVVSSKNKRSHKAPLFDCGCFDCYTSYWSRWDSSPSRELIHQIIEAFEDHISTGESSTSHKSKGRGKKKEKPGRLEEPIAKITEPPQITVASDEIPPEKSPECEAECTGNETEKSLRMVNGHKGLARKVLPDILGLFNSRFWSLWNPNA